MLGPAEDLLERYYLDHCDNALDDFCGLFWPCAFKNKYGRCRNFQEGHTKGHQNKTGKIIGAGNYQSDFSWELFESEWLGLLRENVQHIQAQLGQQMLGLVMERPLASIIHLRHMNEFYRRLGGADRFVSHSACFCCLSEPPEHPLPCGHVLCSSCVKDYGEMKRGSFIYMKSCPLDSEDANFPTPWLLKLKPELAGVRILTLDGGGIRGIVELEVLREIERALGDKLPIQQFFDLIVGTSTGGIIALGLGVEQWRVDTCISKFTRLVREAFTPRLPGMRFSSRYRTHPFEQALRKSFREESLFGGHHDSATSYATKVAVTASTDTGDQAVVLANYNRQIEAQPNYTFKRPDKPEHELRLWEVARATSAAPTYFRPFVNKRTNEGYLDGALFHNNPVKIAYRESKLIWPDVERCHPDILLSIGTGHNGRNTPGSVESRLPHQRRTEPMAESLVNPERGGLKQALGNWLKIPFFAQFLGVLVNRVDNILDSEQIWLSFRSDVLDSRTAQECRRYERFNPNLDRTPPRLDDVEEYESLQKTVMDKLRTKSAYRKKIARIVHRLVASCFYFEKISQPQPRNSYYICHGKIRCRFPDGSVELRHFGDFLRQRQETDFQPYFQIKDLDTKKVNISPNTVEKMITLAKFEVDMVEIRIPLQLRPTVIDLCLLEEGTDKETFVPISGFPRALAVEEALQRSST